MMTNLERYFHKGCSYFDKICTDDLIFNIMFRKIEHMGEKWIRASEIADYMYCSRSWWLKRVQHHSSANVQEMKRGTRHHKEHGRSVQRSIWSQRLAYALIFGVIVIITFQLLMNGS